MLRVLKARMFENSITEKDIAKLTGRSERAVRGKIKQEKRFSPFSLDDIVLIRNTYFPGANIEELFASDGIKTREQSPS